MTQQFDFLTVPSFLSKKKKRTRGTVRWDEMKWRREQICSQEADGWNFWKRFAVWPTIFGLERKAGAMSSKNSRGEQSGAWPSVPRELTGATLAPKSLETLRELQRRRPQDQMSETMFLSSSSGPFPVGQIIVCVLFAVRTFRFVSTRRVPE